MNISIEVTHNGETRYFEGDGWVEVWEAIKTVGNYVGDTTMEALGQHADNGGSRPTCRQWR